MVSKITELLVTPPHKTSNPIVAKFECFRSICLGSCQWLCILVIRTYLLFLVSAKRVYVIVVLCNFLTERPYQNI